MLVLDVRCTAGYAEYETLLIKRARMQSSSNGAIALADDHNDDFGRLSPTLTAAFLGCSASAAWTLEARRGLREATESADDPQADLIIRKGHEHEAACLASLKERFGDFVEIPSGAFKARFAATVAAMERGSPLIYQAALTAGSWLGYADFLVRVEDTSPRWAWSYEPWDAKLARNARPEHLLQIALYGDLLGAVQGRVAQQGCLMLGTGEAETPYKVESFPLHEVRFYVRRAARRLEAFAAHLPTGLEPEPCGFCSKCNWSADCEARWERADHLCRVADITKRQTRRLTDAGVSTLSMLARHDGARIAGIAPETLVRLANGKERAMTPALAGKAVPATELSRAAHAHGLTSKAICSARESLEVEVARNGFGPGGQWLWSLPRKHIDAPLSDEKVSASREESNVSEKRQPNPEAPLVGCITGKSARRRVQMANLLRIRRTMKRKWLRSLPLPPEGLSTSVASRCRSIRAMAMTPCATSLSWVPCGGAARPSQRPAGGLLTGLPVGQGTARPFFVGRPGWVRSSAWICDFSSLLTGLRKGTKGRVTAQTISRGRRISAVSMNVL
jgi:hypothetical protein